MAKQDGIKRRKQLSNFRMKRRSDEQMRLDRALRWSHTEYSLPTTVRYYLGF